jgi:hypothetical protein
VGDTLSRRALNRATLARQHLLERAAIPALDMVEHLAGMQSQAPLAPYVGLWSRIRDFAAADLATLTQDRAVVRLHLMRNTVHLASARDALAWRLLFHPLLAAQFRGHFGGRTAIQADDLLAQARDLLTERPLTRAELGRSLAQRWPGEDPNTLAYAVTHHIALCQVPPRGVWGGSQGRAAWTPLETWLGRPLPEPNVEDVVRRYLGAFGPAGVTDVQAWSGLTRLDEVVGRLPLRTFTTETGATVYDLADAPRPDEDTPAPPRLLPEYDNLLLSYRDRTRVNPDGRPVPLPPGHGATVGTFLVDGLWRGTWRITGAVLRLTPFGPLPARDRDELTAEAVRLAEFIAGRPAEAVLDPPPR